MQEKLAKKHLLFLSVFFSIPVNSGGEEGDECTPRSLHASVVPDSVVQLAALTLLWLLILIIITTMIESKGKSSSFFVFMSRTAAVHRKVPEKCNDMPINIQ